MVVRDDESVDDLIARAMAYADRAVNERKNLQAMFCESVRTSTNRKRKASVAETNGTVPLA